MSAKQHRDMGGGCTNHRGRDRLRMHFRVAFGEQAFVSCIDRRVAAAAAAYDDSCTTVENRVPGKTCLLDRFASRFEGAKRESVQLAHSPQVVRR